MGARVLQALDRLHDSVSGIQGEDLDSWRLDLDLPPRCSEGQGELFVMIHNHTETLKTFELDIIVAKGSQHIRVLESVRQQRHTHLALQMRKLTKSPN